MKVAVLGPEGTFSEKAALRSFPDATVVYRDDFESVVRTVESKDADIGIIPLENSLEGAVASAMDLLLEMKVEIVGEIVEPVRQCLLGRGDPSSIKVILSHPQGLAQCRKYLKSHFPNAELRTTGSTSHAAKLAQEFPEMAAVAGEGAAAMYGLKVLKRDIQDFRSNSTRFAVLGLAPPGRTGKDKTSIVVHLERTRPGALYRILKEFALRDINLTRIESRPSRQELGDYYFFIDLEGHKDDLDVKEALEAISKMASMVKVLGSYPQATG